jgi:uncharacterized protein (TIGR02284 family)
VSMLNDLIETCHDAAKGFKTAADGVRDVQVKSLFNRFAEERKQFATELSDQVRRLGGQPEEGGSVSGALQRGWMDLKRAVTGKDESAIIAEAERGEDVTVRSYEEALDAGLPPAIRPTVERQYSRVRTSHDQVRNLEVGGSSWHSGEPPDRERW